MMSMSMFRASCRDPQWLLHAVNGVRCSGFFIVEDVLGADLVEATKAAMYRVRDTIVREVGEKRLRRANEIGVLRLMLKHDDLFYRYLEIPQLLAVVDAVLSDTAILHLQNGFILPSFDAGSQPRVFQNSFHQDFPRVLNGYVMSLNAMFAVDPFSRANGATFVVPGSHQRTPAPDWDAMDGLAVAAECPAGSMIFFDSTLWHAAGRNTSGADRLAINQQFTRSYVKQQVDYVRALGDAEVLRQQPRTQQLLGWYSRVVTSLDDYYQPESERRYRKGQG